MEEHKKWSQHSQKKTLQKIYVGGRDDSAVFMNTRGRWRGCHGSGDRTQTFNRFISIEVHRPIYRGPTSISEDVFGKLMRWIR